MMGSVTACCGHKLKPNEDIIGYWWKTYDKECEECIAYGYLCSKCISVYRAVKADTFEEAQELLRETEPRWNAI